MYHLYVLIYIRLTWEIYWFFEIEGIFKEIVAWKEYSFNIGTNPNNKIK